ncbi:RluA family pseudouridine synthase [bacterium]|nr:MAG: RluA family pseudouridine synthase [bacterium]
MQVHTIKVIPEDSGKRLDLFLLVFARQKKLGFSRTHIQLLIEEGNITLGESTCIKSNYKIKANEEFKVRLPVKGSADIVRAEDIPLEVIYEDQDLAVINKQAGLVVHPAPGNPKHTLVNALLYHFKDLSDINPHRPGIVHRLDKETSGLLVIAKNNFTHLALAQQFAKHSIKRKYVALVKGKVEFNEGVIEIPIGRDPKKRKSMSVGFSEGTKYAKTYYRTLRRTSVFSLLELEPFTGRTHQLRVHLNFLGHPILGDLKYGSNNRFSRLALHAEYLGFRHPRSDKFIDFSCDTPPEFREFLKKNTS